MPSELILPASQETQKPDPTFSADSVPGAQSVHAVPFALNRPRSHARQLSWFVLGSKPTSQGRQMIPSGLWRPDGHAKHMVRFPAGSDPAAHGLHCTPSAENIPGASHGSHSVRVGIHRWRSHSAGVHTAGDQVVLAGDHRAGPHEALADVHRAAFHVALAVNHSAACHVWFSPVHAIRVSMATFEPFSYLHSPN